MVRLNHEKKVIQISNSLFKIIYVTKENVYMYVIIF